MRADIWGSMECYPLFQHYLCTIDAYATLTARGEGNLITSLARQGRLPSPYVLARNLHQSIRSKCYVIKSEEGEKLLVQEIEGIMGFHQKTVHLASKIGLAGQRLRAAKVNEQAQFFEDFDLEKIMLPGMEFNMGAQERRDEVKMLELELITHWENKPSNPTHKSPDKPDLDERVREIFWHVSIPRSSSFHSPSIRY